MSLSEEQIQALAEAVAEWRLQEYISISLYSFYIYYVLTTVKEEVAIVFPQKWNLGKILFVVIRYGICITIVLQLARNYRNYYSISPMTCKAIMIVYDVTYYSAVLACNASLGLFLGAFLQARKRYLIPIMALCVIPPLYAFVFGMLSDIQYPAEEVSGLDIELGYPCYVPSSEAWAKSTARGLARDIRQYISFAAATLILLLAVAALVFRYKGQHNRLVQVVRNDGGLYYLALVALRLGYSITTSPAIFSLSAIDSNPFYITLTVSNAAIIPILAQRLMINIRKVDYIGTRPIASTLLFAHTAPSSEETEETDGSGGHSMPERSAALRRHQGTKEGEGV